MRYGKPVEPFRPAVQELLHSVIRLCGPNFANGKAYDYDLGHPAVLTSISTPVLALKGQHAGSAARINQAGISDGESLASPDTA